MCASIAPHSRRSRPLAFDLDLDLEVDFLVFVGIATPLSISLADVPIRVRRQDSGCTRRAGVHGNR
jgi:hypothetical protein